MVQTANKDTQTRLLDAAAQLMWQRSYQATGVDELCRWAEAKKGSFYHFFPSKTELAIAAVERSWRQIREQVYKPVFNSDAGGLDQLLALVNELHAFQMQTSRDMGGYLGCPFGSLAQEMARQDERLRLSLERIFHAHYDYIEGALNKAKQAGDIPPGNNHQRAQRIFALLEGAMLLSKVCNDPEIFHGVGESLRVIAAT